MLIRSRHHLIKVADSSGAPISPQEEEALPSRDETTSPPVSPAHPVGLTLGWDPIIAIGVFRTRGYVDMQSTDAQLLPRDSIVTSDVGLISRATAQRMSR